MYTTSIVPLKDIRAALIQRGTSFCKFCEENGFCRVAVAAALKGKRTGPKSQALASAFLAKVEETK